MHHCPTLDFRSRFQSMWPTIGAKVAGSAVNKQLKAMTTKRNELLHFCQAFGNPVNNILTSFDFPVSNL
jgi:hypothetical protein